MKAGVVPGLVCKSWTPAPCPGLSLCVAPPLNLLSLLLLLQAVASWIEATAWPTFPRPCQDRDLQWHLPAPEPVQVLGAPFTQHLVKQLFVCFPKHLLQAPAAEQAG